MHGRSPRPTAGLEVQEWLPIRKEEGLKIVPVRNIPRIPHIPRTETPARAKWGMRGMGGKISPLTR